MKSTFILLLTILFTAFPFYTDFLSEQKKFVRVKTAFTEKQNVITEKLNGSGINPGELNILATAFKEEQTLEIYAKKRMNHPIKKFQPMVFVQVLEYWVQKENKAIFRCPKDFII
ncbi:MAG TPA: hypothetical protein VFF35_09530 [Bacteroidia bacterium]|nr:hypothetical protein [Bacteroidia bacterium]